MKKLSKTTYNKIVKAKILNTGLYNGRSVEEADIVTSYMLTLMRSDKTTRKAY
jgi:hypothetical protein